MKKIYLSIITVLAGLSVNAQLTQANHAPTAGDLFSTWQCDPAGITPGGSGAAVTWNYATIATSLSVVSDYTAKVNANTSYPIPGVELASSPSNMAYYKSSAADLKYYGGNIIAGSISASLIYTTAAITAVYPMALNSTSTAATAGSISIPALSQTGTFTGNSNTLADGTGTLILPSGTYTNVIRVVTTQTINFNVQLGAGTVTQKNWDYYKVGTKESLFSFATSTIVSIAGTSTQTTITRTKPATQVGVNENTVNTINLSIYPNPSNSDVNFSTKDAEAKQVMVYDITGKLVEKQNLTNGKLKLDVIDFTSGLYIYRLMGHNNQILKSGKFTVSH